MKPRKFFWKVLPNRTWLLISSSLGGRHWLPSIRGIYVDSLEDIVANKIIAMADRFDSKDFFDVWMIAKRTRLDMGSMLKLAEEKPKANYRFTRDSQR